MLTDLIKNGSLSRIHRRSEINNLKQTANFKMTSTRHDLDDLTKLNEIDVLLRLERVSHKKLTHLQQSIHLSNPQTLTVTMVLTNHSGSEEPFECVENLHVRFMLNDDKLRQHLITYGHLFVTIQAHMKAAFTVNKTDNPIWGQFHKNTYVGYSACSL